MCFESVYKLEGWVFIYSNGALACRDEEQIVGVIPRDFVNLHTVFLCHLDGKSTCIYEADGVALVSHCNVVAIRAPADINVLPTGLNNRCAFSS